MRLNGSSRVRTIMTHYEIHQQLTNYVLGLLKPGQADEVAKHLAVCADCRRSVHGEREIGKLVRETLSITTRSDPARLRRLMPPVPQQSRQGKIAATWSGRLAPALVLLLVIMGGLLLNAPDSERPLSFFTAATATATSTNTPTATIAQETSNMDAHTPVFSQENVVEAPTYQVGSPGPTLTVPAPPQPPTPVAAINQMATN